MYNHINSTDCAICLHKEVCGRKEDFQSIQKSLQERFEELTVEKPWISYGGLQCQTYAEIPHNHGLDCCTGKRLSDGYSHNSPGCRVSTYGGSLG
jgi:hypothetical protein